jgi:hypothetical protein
VHRAHLRHFGGDVTVLHVALRVLERCRSFGSIRLDRGDAALPSSVDGTASDGAHMRARLAQRVDG